MFADRVERTQAIHHTEETNRKRLAAGTIRLIKVEQNGTAAQQNSSDSAPFYRRESTTKFRNGAPTARPTIQMNQRISGKWDI